MSLAIVCDICERFVRTGTPLDGWEKRWMAWDKARGEPSPRWSAIDMSNAVEAGVHRCPSCSQKDKEEAGSSDLVERIRTVVREEIARMVSSQPATPTMPAPRLPDTSSGVPGFTLSAERKEEEE